MTAGANGIPAGDCDCDGNQLDALGECGGSCPDDTDGDGVCDDAEVDGCTNPFACNFSAAATDDDGSCLTADVLGALRTEAALPMRMVTVSATTWTTAWAPSTPVASAMGPARSMTAGAPEFPLETAIAMETSSTPSASVAGPALPTPMATASATMRKSMAAPTPLPATSALQPPTMTDRV